MGCVFPIFLPSWNKTQATTGWYSSSQCDTFKPTFYTSTVQNQKTLTAIKFTHTKTIYIPVSSFGPKLKNELVLECLHCNLGRVLFFPGSQVLTVKSTKSHGISPTASRWNRSHSKIDVGIGPKFFFAEGGLSPTFWDLFHHQFWRCGKGPRVKNSVV